LTCHVFQLLALTIGSLPITVVQLGCEALLINAVGTAPLLEPRLMAALPAAIAMPAIAGATDEKNGSASGTSTLSLAKLNWQRTRAFLKAGLDNGRRSWQAMLQYFGGTLTGSTRSRPQPPLTAGAFLLPPLEDKNNAAEGNQHLPGEWMKIDKLLQKNITLAG
jgi:hypothetical protein